MTIRNELPEKYLPQLARARAGLTVSDEIGLALRAHRRALGLSQRRYAASRGLSRAMLARLEAGAGSMSLDTVVEALRGTGFTLRVGMTPTPPRPTGAAQLDEEVAAKDLADDDAARCVELSRAGPQPCEHVPPGAWDPTDLIARVRGGSRRFPAHRDVLAVADPPLWWWIHEFFNGPTEKPQWYSPEGRYGRF